MRKLDYQLLIKIDVLKAQFLNCLGKCLPENSPILDVVVPIDKGETLQVKPTYIESNCTKIVTMQIYNCGIEVARLYYNLEQNKLSLSTIMLSPTDSNINSTRSILNAILWRLDDNLKIRYLKNQWIIKNTKRKISHKLLDNFGSIAISIKNKDNYYVI